VLFATSVIWIILGGALILHDPLTPQHFLGILFVLLGVFIISERKGGIKLSKGVIYSLATGAFFGMAVVGWTYVARRSDAPTWAALSFLIPAALVLIARPKSVHKMKAFLAKNVLTDMIMLGVLMSVAALTMLYAYKFGNANVVAALLQTSIVVTTILGIVFLHECKDILRKALASTICLLGVILLIR
jgi:drug/metabolite transporter (DMT)-like permease